MLPNNVSSVLNTFSMAGVPCSTIGLVTAEKLIHITVGDEVVLNECTLPLVFNVYD